MAKNTNNRIALKWVRDKAKSAYEKEGECFICGTDKDLELHHVVSLSDLLDKWAAAKGYDISTDEGILEVREEFIAEHQKEIYDDVFTLCNRDHVRLHGVFGKKPLLSTAERQLRWIDKQKAKFSGDSRYASIASEGGSGSFSKFY